jgi:hypothetical protein
MGGASSTHVRDEDIYNTLVGKSEGKRSLGRPRRRWKDNIKEGGYGIASSGSGYG